MECKDQSGQTYWTHKNTLEESYEHPGVKVFQLNKRLLKHKAEEELLGSFKGVFARKHAIMETLLGLKHRIVTELIKQRLRKVYPRADMMMANTLANSQNATNAAPSAEERDDDLQL